MGDKGAYKGQMIFKTPKSRKGRRMISLSPSTSIVLREYREAREKMFNELGKPVSETDLETQPKSPKSPKYQHFSGTIRMPIFGKTVVFG